LFTQEALSVDVDRQGLLGEGIDNGPGTQAPPSDKASETKFIDHISLGTSAAGCLSRSAVLTCQRGRLSRKIKAIFPMQRVFGPVGHISAAEAEANYFAANAPHMVA